ncbi:transcriptional repressor [Nakamurella silvestris]|nr:transcriptional repressor [Nakamurella silvestris]
MTTPRPRTTRQRTAVSSVLSSVDEFRSAQDIHSLLRDRGDEVSLTTVYRILADSAEAGEVDVLRNDGGESLYRRCSTAHHHHLVCADCGRTVEISGSAVEAWTNAMATENGFTEISHTIEILGRCADCTALHRTG